MNKKVVLLVIFVLIIGALTVSEHFCIDKSFVNGSVDIVSEKTLVADIPVIETYDRNVPQGPLIILQHGFKNNKESTLPLATKLAEKGFYVVSPDACCHGDRKETERSLGEIIVATSKDYDKIIECFCEKNPEIKENFGIAGWSMGGCVAYHYGVNGKYKPKALAPVISTPYFEQFIGHKLGISVYNAKNGVHLEENPEKIEEYHKYLDDNSPFDRIENLRGIALLLQNGEEDTYVTSKGSEMLVDSMKKANDDNIQYIVIPKAKHQVTDEMKDNIVRFMCSALIQKNSVLTTEFFPWI